MEAKGTKGIDFAAIPLTAVKVLTSPAAFFRGMQKTGGFIEPLIFMVAMGVVSGIIQAVLNILHLNVMGGIGAGVGAIIILPIFIAIFGFIGAGIVFVIWKVMGSRESYETAFRCIAYMGVLSPITTILGIIPFLGAVAGILIGTYFIVIVSVEVHKIPVKKAWTVFGIIAVIFILLNISGQLAVRKLSSDTERFQKDMQEAATQMQKSAEEAKEAAEKADKAASNMNEKMQKQMEKQAEEMKRAAEEMQKRSEEMKQQNSR